MIKTDPVGPSEQGLIEIMPVYEHQFWSNSPALDLYNASQASGYHYEGQAAVDAVQRMVDHFRYCGLERVSHGEMSDRLRSVIGYANSVFSAIEDVEAVVFYGGALRGKPLFRERKNDFDFRLVTTFCPPDTSDMVNPVMNEVENRVSSVYIASPNIPRELEAVPVQFFINSSFEDPLGLGLSYVSNAPYLAIIRTTQAAPAIFFNCAGTKDLMERPGKT